MAKFDSTILPQTNDPKEIQKMGLDLLDKINQLSNVISSIKIPSTSGFAPLPTASAGAGQFLGGTNFWSTSGAALNLPSGGSWAYNIIGINSGTGAQGANPKGGIAAGGTAVGPATANIIWEGWCWEIQESSPVDFTQPIYLMPDGSYVVTKINGYPYNALEKDEQWPAIQKWISEGGRVETK